MSERLLISGGTIFKRIQRSPSNKADMRLLQRGSKPMHSRSLVFLFLSFAVACSEPAQIMRTSSQPSRPTWIDKQPQNPAFLYFVGVSTNMTSLEEGRNQAIKDANTKIASYLGTDIESSFHVKETEVDIDIQSESKSKSSARIINAEVYDQYYETMTRIDNRLTLERHDYYVLVRFPRARANEEIERQEMELKTKIQASINLFSKAARLEAEKRYREARTFFREAMKSVSGVDPDRSVDGERFHNVKELATVISLKVDEITKRLRRTYVRIDEKNIGKTTQSSVMAERLKANLSQNGYVIVPMEGLMLDVEGCRNGDTQALAPLRRSDVKMLILGDVETTYSSTIMKNFFYFAKGRVYAIDVDSGDILFVLPVEEKGYNREKWLAGIDALKRAGDSLSNLLIQKFDSLDGLVQ